MKILNLYAGIGGNRKQWGEEHEVTAIEINPSIASIYQDFFPNDKVIVCDAHKYLLEHFDEFDFIWSSPPCQTHSKMRLAQKNHKSWTKEYPNMDLYQEIIFLKHYFKGKWVVENVNGYYIPLIKPQVIGRHYYWSNFNINIKEKKTQTFCLHYRGQANNIVNREEMLGIKILDYHGYKGDKRKLYDACVEPETALKILHCGS